MGGFKSVDQEQRSMNYSAAENRSDSYGASNQMSTSNQSALNQAANQATSATSLYGAQAPFLQSMWGQAQALSGGDPGVAAQARGAWGEALAGGINPGVADVIQNASADMGLNFSRNTLPGIRRGAVGTGSLGGSRQGIAEGLAAGEVARNQSNMATTLYTQALDQASRERTAALSMSGAMQSLPWQGLESFSRVLGGPVMESFGQSAGSSYGSSAGSAYGQGGSANVAGSHGYALSSGASTGDSNEFGMNVLAKGK